MFILLYKRELFFNIEIKSSDKKDTTKVVPFFMTNDYNSDTKLAWVFMEKIKSRTVKKG